MHEAYEVCFLPGKLGCVARNSLAEVDAHRFWKRMFAASRLVCVIHKQPAVALSISHAQQESLGASPRIHSRHIFKWCQHLHMKVSDKRRNACRLPVDLRLLSRALQHHLVVWFSVLPFLVLCSTCFLKCSDDACLELLPSLCGTQFVNVADLAAKHANNVYFPLGALGLFVLLSCCGSFRIHRH